jgi:hypothetical protein
MSEIQEKNRKRNAGRAHLGYSRAIAEYGGREPIAFSISGWRQPRGNTCLAEQIAWPVYARHLKLARRYVLLKRKEISAALGLSARGYIVAGSPPSESA